MSRKIKRAAAIGAVLALAAAPAALAAKPADPGSQGQGHANGHAKNGGKGAVSYVFKGAYQLDGNVAVEKGNAHARKAGLDSGIVLFDLSTAKVVVADVNGDGPKDVNDLSAQDRVVVKARLPRKNPGAGPYVAKQVVDQTHPDSAAD